MQRIGQRRVLTAVARICRIHVLFTNSFCNLIYCILSGVQTVKKKKTQNGVNN